MGPKQDSALAKTKRRHQPNFMKCLRSLQADMLNLFENGNHSDLKITCKDVIFNVHRAIVLPRCEFFRLCLQAGFKEHEEGAIKLVADDPNAVRMALREMYTRSPRTVRDSFTSNEDHNFATFVETWKVADKYSLPELGYQCLASIETVGDVELLKERAGVQWTRDLLSGLSASNGLGTLDDGREYNREIRDSIKNILLCSKNLAEMDEEEEEVLKDDPDLAIEVLKFALKTPPSNRPPTTTSCLSNGQKANNTNADPKRRQTIEDSTSSEGDDEEEDRSTSPD